jgi:hypothetical protein
MRFLMAWVDDKLKFYQVSWYMVCYSIFEGGLGV